MCWPQNLNQCPSDHKHRGHMPPRYTAAVHPQMHLLPHEISHALSYLGVSLPVTPTVIYSWAKQNRTFHWANFRIREFLFVSNYKLLISSFMSNKEQKIYSLWLAGFCGGCPFFKGYLAPKLVLWKCYDFSLPAEAAEFILGEKSYVFLKDC